MPKATPMSIAEAFTKLRFLPDRTPETTDEERKGAFARLVDFRDGGIFTGHYAGNSEWERHPKGDELVMVVEGRTTLYLLNRSAVAAHCDDVLALLPAAMARSQ